MSKMKRLLALGLSPWVAWVILVGIIIYGIAALSLDRDMWLQYYQNDFKVTPPILVISSDDWGGVSPPETATDLYQIRNILRRFKDAYGNHPVITAYINPAAPDFEEIIRSDYKKYTWRFCYEHNPVLVNLWRSLAEEGFFNIQFHGREHINIPLWLSALQEDLPGFRESCGKGYIGQNNYRASEVLVEKDARFPFLFVSFVDASTNPPRALPLETQKYMVRTGLRIIREHFLTNPEIVVAPGHIWDVSTWRAFKEKHIEYIETIRVPIVEVGPGLELIQTHNYVNWFSNRHGIKAVIRNCFYEPNWGLAESETEVNYSRKALRRAERALRRLRRRLLGGEPAVLATHKYNYVADGADRKRANLEGLESLLLKVQTEFPSVAFLSASDLGHYMHNRAHKATRKIPFTKTTLSRTERIQNTVKCLWLCHREFRLWFVVASVALAWCVLTLIMSKKILAMSK